MKRNADGSVLLVSAEALSLAKLVAACHDRIANLVDDIDFLGDTSHFRALQMWDDVLSGMEVGDLDDYVGEDEMGKAKTVEQWLALYGRR